jgi:hypothetical protein
MVLNIRINLCCILIFAFSACENPNAGMLGISNDMKAAKKNHTFICEYALPNNEHIININDSIRIDIQECYMENVWTHTKDYDIHFADTSYYFMMIGDIKSMRSFPFEWQIGEDTADVQTWCARSSYDCIMHKYHKQPDSLHFLVFTGDWPPRKPKKILGSFTLYKKARR